MPYTVEILRRAAKTLRSLTDQKLYHRLLVLVVDIGHRRETYRS